MLIYKKNILHFSYFRFVDSIPTQGKNSFTIINSLYRSNLHHTVQAILFKYPDSNDSNKSHKISFVSPVLCRISSSGHKFLNEIFQKINKFSINIFKALKLWLNKKETW
jgi:hypothetical protein